MPPHPPVTPGGRAAAPLAEASDPAALVLLDGHSLTLEQVRRVARGRAPVAPAATATAAMRRTRALVEAVVAEGRPAYGLTTGVGVRKRNRSIGAGHDDLLVRQHLVGQGAAAPAEVVRATTLLLANSLARGSTAARPALLHRVVERLNADRLPVLRLHGSVGSADLAQLADLAEGLVHGEAGVSGVSGEAGDAAAGPLLLERGEAIALLSHNAFATGWAALAIADALDLADALDCSGALSLEALAAHPDLLDPAVADARPLPGPAVSRARMAALVAGSTVRPRSLQDPLTFRNLPQLNGAARDGLAFAAGQVRAELNAVQSNPLLLPDPAGPPGAGRVISTGTPEAASLALALDVARLALAPALTAAAERTVKLLQAPLTGLPEGLAVRPGLAECGLSEYGIAVQSLVAEARLLAAPVSLELPSTSQAEGIEDRTTMAPLAARRLAELVGLGRRVLALELLVAAQGCDLRRDLEGAEPGPGSAAVLAAVRARVPFVGEGDPLPDVEPLVALVAEGLPAPAAPVAAPADVEEAG
jgi:histidine ammonia-lyase